MIFYSTGEKIQMVLFAFCIILFSIKKAGKVIYLCTYTVFLNSIQRKRFLAGMRSHQYFERLRGSFSALAAAPSDLEQRLRLRLRAKVPAPAAPAPAPAPAQYIQTHIDIHIRTLHITSGS